MHIEYLNIILIASLALLDAVMYGYFWELKKHPAGILFVIMPFKGKNYYPAYRLFQGALDAVAVYLLYSPSHGGLGELIIDNLELIGFILAWYLMAKEFLYYVFLSVITWSSSHFAGLEQYEQDKYIPYWLARPWFAGWWLFSKSFTLGKFIAVFLIGMAILIISNW